MQITHLFGRRYVWLMNHEGRWYLSLADKKKPSTPYVIDETLVRCDRFSRLDNWDFSPVKDPPEDLIEVAYAACKKYLETNGDS